ncbi:MAG: hypothetical protein ACOCY8_03340 [Spirochaetota bacterium]
MRFSSGTVVSFYAALLLAVGGVGGAAAQTLTNEGRWTAPIVPAPRPFTLNSYDVIDAVWLLRRVRFVQWWDYENRPETIAVERVRSVWVDYNPNAYEGHRNRYDIELNDEPIDWDHIYVEYDGDMINLRVLYTYRNQQPAPDVPYRLRRP